MTKLCEMDEKHISLLKKYNEQLNVNNELRSRVDNLQKSLEWEIDDWDQRQRENNLIIKGVPEWNPN